MSYDRKKGVNKKNIIKLAVYLKLIKIMLLNLLNKKDKKKKYTYIIFQHLNYIRI